MKSMTHMPFSPTRGHAGGTGSIAFSLIDAVWRDRILKTRIS
jgi:hypothetical protein